MKICIEKAYGCCLYVPMVLAEMFIYLKKNNNTIFENIEVHIFRTDVF